MAEFSKLERKALRELAGEVYEAEAAQLLEELAASFKRWRAPVTLIVKPDERRFDGRSRRM